MDKCMTHCQIRARMMFSKSVVIWREVVIQLCTLYFSRPTTVLSASRQTCPRARAQQAFIWRLDLLKVRTQTSARQAPAFRVCHVAADWLFMSVQHRFQTVSKSQIQRKMPAMFKNLTPISTSKPLNQSLNFAPLTTSQIAYLPMCKILSQSPHGLLLSIYAKLHTPCSPSYFFRIFSHCRLQPRRQHGFWHITRKMCFPAKKCILGFYI